MRPLPPLIRRQLAQYLRRPVHIRYVPAKSAVLFVRMGDWL